MPFQMMHPQHRLLQGEAERIVADFGIAEFFAAVVGASPDRASKADVVAQALGNNKPAGAILKSF
jgi:hypothetical protein